MLLIKEKQNYYHIDIVRTRNKKSVAINRYHSQNFSHTPMAKSTRSKNQKFILIQMLNLINIKTEQSSITLL